MHFLYKPKLLFDLFALFALFAFPSAFFSWPAWSAGSASSLIEQRRVEIKERLAEIDALIESGIASKHDREPLECELIEIDQFENLLKYRTSRKYETVLVGHLEEKLVVLQNNIETQKKLLEDGLVAPKEIEKLEEKAGLYNQVLEYLGSAPFYGPVNLGKGSIKMIALLGAAYPITSGFGYRADPMGRGRQFHTGVDVGAGTGTPIRSPFAGKVRLTIKGTGSGGGRQVWLQHGDGVETVYMHLSQIVVSSGQVLEKGEVLGYVGSSGSRVTGPHLHFELHFRGIPVDPIRYL